MTVREFDPTEPGAPQPRVDEMWVAAGDDVDRGGEHRNAARRSCDLQGPRHGRALMTHVAGCTGSLARVRC